MTITSIKDFPGYFIWESGIVMTYDGLGRKSVSPRLIDGVQYVYLNRKGKSMRRPIHRLLAEQFIDNPDNLPLVKFKDGNKQNLDLANLYWASHDKNVTRGSNWGARPHEIEESNKG